MKKVTRVITKQHILPVAGTPGVPVTTELTPFDLPESDGEIVGISVSGDITDAEYDQILLTIERGERRPIESVPLRVFKTTDYKSYYPIIGLNQKATQVKVKTESQVASINGERAYISFHMHQPQYADKE